ncbi:hypothetical protein ACJZ2D_002500 [Fusarium nematophilum]
MSGAEIVGLISGIIAIIDASIKFCNAAADTSSLPSGFGDVATRLPLVQETLVTTMEGLDANSEPSKSSLALKSVFEACKQRLCGWRICSAPTYSLRGRGRGRGWEKPSQPSRRRQHFYTDFAARWSR